jgi:hypothetical protein
LAVRYFDGANFSAWFSSTWSYGGTGIQADAPFARVAIQRHSLR